MWCIKQPMHHVMLDAYGRRGDDEIWTSTAPKRMQERSRAQVLHKGQAHRQELSGVSQEVSRGHRVHIILDLRPAPHTISDHLPTLPKPIMVCCAILQYA